MYVKSHVIQLQQQWPTNTDVSL